MNDTMYKPYKPTLADAQKEAIIAEALHSESQKLQMTMVKAIGEHIDKIDVSKLFSKIIEADEMLIPVYDMPPIHYSVRLSRKPGYIAWDEITPSYITIT